jgi:hypothetical protein
MRAINYCSRLGVTKDKVTDIHEGIETFVTVQIGVFTSPHFDLVAVLFAINSASAQVIRS